MRTVKPSREYHETLRRAGIKNPGETLYELPIKLVTLIDDLRYMKPPIVVPIAGGQVFKAGVGGQAPIPVEVEIRSRGGAWILGFENSSGSATQFLHLYTQPQSVGSQITIGAANFVPDFQSPPGALATHESIWSHGYAGVAANAGLRTARNNSFVVPDIWVPFGTFVGLKSDSLGAGAGGWLLIREVPIGAPGDA